MPTEPTSVFATWAQYFLMWIGFGTLVGLLAKAILPGKDPGGAFATVVIGVLGSVIGAATLAYFSPELRVTPISVMGFVVALCGTGVLLLSNRLLTGRIIKEGYFPGFRNRRKVAVVVKR